MSNWSNPITTELANRYLSDKTLREEFLLNYNFFNEDGNRKLYKAWILENIDKNKNEILENAYRLANSANIYVPPLLKKGGEILEGKCFQFTKLAVLEYLLDQKGKIEKRKNVSLAKGAFLHTKNHIIRFQAFLNLLALEGETRMAMNYIRRTLKNTIYPTLFYRVLNQMQVFPKPVKLSLVNLIVDELYDKNFSQEVIDELVKRVAYYNKMKN